MTPTTMKIADILTKSEKRHRQDFGDIDGLAESITAVGLMHPVVVNSDGKLIAGARRILAAQKLGWTEIPVTVVDLENIVEGEFAENTQRKDFTSPRPWRSSARSNRWKKPRRRNGSAQADIREGKLRANCPQLRRGGPAIRRRKRPARSGAR